MLPSWATLVESDQFQIAVRFLDGRLTERMTVEWALGLTPNDQSQRAALVFLLNTPKTRALSEPWRTAWRLIEESWGDNRTQRDYAHALYEVSSRIKEGERSGSLISEIVDLVMPRVEVKALSPFDLSARKPRKRPRAVRDLLSLGVTSGPVVDPSELGLSQIREPASLLELSHGLASAVAKAIDISVRIGWDTWFFSEVRRVYFVAEDERGTGEYEPDAFKEGVAPAVKLLYASVQQLSDFDIAAAVSLVSQWKAALNPLYIRLWASFARDRRFASASDVCEFLTNSEDRIFWNLHTFPEVAELRAKRFAEFPQAARVRLLERIKAAPPASFWPRATERSAVADGRRFWAAREMTRVEVSGANLPKAFKAWLKDEIAVFPDLAQMSRVSEGFLSMGRVRPRDADPDERFDMLEGEARLAALELSLASSKHSFEDDPADKARDWMRKAGNIGRLAETLAATEKPSEYPNVWQQFGWQHSPAEKELATGSADSPATLRDLLLQLTYLSPSTIERAVEGLTYWLSTWARLLPQGDLRFGAWECIWPRAHAATNAKSQDGATSFDASGSAAGAAEPADLDTLNTPAGRMVGAFLGFCPAIKKRGRPFSSLRLRGIRTLLLKSTDRSALVVKHRLLEYLEYFLRADRAWAKRHLVGPLLRDSQEALKLWRAVARRVRYTDVLRELGPQFIVRAADARLPRSSRKTLLFSLVVEVMHSIKDGRKSAISPTELQQLLRTVDDEMRAHAANVPQLFLKELATPENLSGSRARLFETVVKRFLQEVWPQERSLVTPGVARALADVPAVAGSAFADAVQTIDRFLMPFECWSLLDYGLYGQESGKDKLDVITDESLAEALMTLLDHTIGTEERAIIPHDLSEALDQIRRVAPSLASSQPYRRLAALTRRQ